MVEHLALLDPLVGFDPVIVYRSILDERFQLGLDLALSEAVREVKVFAVAEFLNSRANPRGPLPEVPEEVMDDFGDEIDPRKLLMLASMNVESMR